MTMTASFCWPEFTASSEEVGKLSLQRRRSVVEVEVDWKLGNWKAFGIEN